MVEKKKDLNIMLADKIVLSDDAKFSLVSTFQATPNQEPLVKHFSLNSSSDAIVTETLQSLEDAGYRLEPKKITILKETVDRGKQWGAGWKIGLHLTGVDFERTPTQETKTSMEMTYEIVKKES